MGIKIALMISVLTFSEVTSQTTTVQGCFMFMCSSTIESIYWVNSVNDFTSYNGWSFWADDTSCTTTGDGGIPQNKIWYTFKCRTHIDWNYQDSGNTYTYHTDTAPLLDLAAERHDCGPYIGQSSATDDKTEGFITIDDYSIHPHSVGGHCHNTHIHMSVNDHLCYDSGTGAYLGDSHLCLPPPSPPPSSPPPPPACGAGTVANATSGACEVDCTSDRRLLEEDDEDRTSFPTAATTVSSYLEAHPELAAQMSDDLRRHIETMIEQHFGQPALA
jgi:hypothetical protein